MKIAALLFASLTTCLGWAQDANKSPKLECPLPGIDLQIKFGINVNYAKSKSDQFYSISYRGNSLSSFGSEAKIPKLGANNPINFGDQPILLTFDRGQTNVGGTIAKTWLTKPLSFGKIEQDSRLRLVFGYDGQFTDSSQSTTSLGAEYSPVFKTEKFLNIKATDFESFTAFGAVSQQRHDPAGASSNTTAAFYRGRIGFGSQFSVSRSKIDRIIQEAEIAKTLTRTDLLRISRNSSVELGNVVALIKADLNVSGANGQAAFEAIQNRILTLTDDEFAKIRSNVATAYAKRAEKLQKAVLAGRAATVVSPDAPGWALYSEFEGFYDLGELQSNSRYRSVYSFNFRYNLFNAQPDRGYISLRYINGFTQAEPNARANGFIASFGFGF